MTGTQSPKSAVDERIAARLRPVLAQISQRYAGHQVQRLLGLWVLWHTFGGRKELLTAGLFSVSSLNRQRVEFQKVFGVAVQDWQPEVAALLATRVTVPGVTA